MLTGEANQRCNIFGISLDVLRNDKPILGINWFLKKYFTDSIIWFPSSTTYFLNIHFVKDVLSDTTDFLFGFEDFSP